MRRRLLIVAAFLLAGVVVNVGVAWGCAILTSERITRSTRYLHLPGSDVVTHPPAKLEHGWPLRSLTRELPVGDGVVAVTAWEFGDESLPLAPVPVPFASNTLFYAAVLWLLIPGPFALRRLIQLKRGLCPVCAYPMGESAVCSECGTARA